MFQKLEMDVKTAAGKLRTIDLSNAAGMKLDYDFDHVQLGIIGDEKTAVALDKMMKSSAYRKQFLEGVQIQADLMDRVKEASKAAGVNTAEARYIQGIQRLVGVKTETGPISNLVGELRAAAAFQAKGTRDFTLASYLFAEMEEGPISSKHGYLAEDIKEHLQTFVSGESTERGVRSAMEDTWMRLYGKEEFEAGGVQYRMKEQIDKMGSWVGAATESQEMAAHRNLARRGGKAMKGAVLENLKPEQLLRAIEQHQGGMGDLNAALTREMRMGPGSGLTRSRQVMKALGGVKDVALGAFAKHWKYPAIGTAIAVGVSSMLSSDEMSMADHGASATALAAGSGTPDISHPSAFQNRLVTQGGGSMSAGYSMDVGGDFSSYGLRQLSSFGQEVSATVTLRDNRGAITPQYIDKVQRERY